MPACVSLQNGPPTSHRPAAFRAALATAIGPVHVILPGIMPRYDISDARCSDLWPARRRLLQAALGLGVMAGLRGLPASADESEAALAAHSAHFPFGPVAPVRPIPAWPVLTQLSQATDLAALVRGRVSALQLMFTGCSATCPIQGALFAQAQEALKADAAGMRFISISIAPLVDTPRALEQWLQQFDAAPGWLAVQPRAEDLDNIFEVLGKGGEARPPGAADPHNGQVYIVDPHGNLVYRTPSLPRSEQIADIMRAVARKSQDA